MLRFTLLGLTGVAVSVAVFRRQPADFILGALAALFANLYVIVSDDVPDHVERHLVGAEGEERTGSVLERLASDGFISRHDIFTGFGNCDHVVVSPRGVFVLETKHPRLYGGSVAALDDDLLGFRGDGSPWTAKGVGRTCCGRAAHIKERLQEVTGHRQWVQAVVVVWASFPQAVVEGNRVVYVAGEKLFEWLRNRPEIPTSSYTACLRFLSALDEDPEVALKPVLPSQKVS